MRYDDVKTEIISSARWGLKLDPTEYCYKTQTIRIREDYYRCMHKSNPLTIHWVYHEFCHHMLWKAFGQEFIDINSANYPNNMVERYAFGYQFYFAKQEKMCTSIDQLLEIDHFFKHKATHKIQLGYYWDNAEYITQELKEKLDTVV